jgi:L-iditol 2-dehydrogenase
MEPLACVVRGQKGAGVKPGQTVLVVGAGIAGLLHTGLARAGGAGPVFAADTIQSRLEMAKKMGADFSIRADEGMFEKIREKNEGRLADLVIICHGEFIQYGIRGVVNGGTVLMFASAPEGAAIPVSVNEIFWRTEVKLLSTYAGSPADCLQALKIIRMKSIPLGTLITHRIKLDDIQKGFQAVASPVEHNSIKVIVEPNRT